MLMEPAAAIAVIEWLRHAADPVHLPSILSWDVLFTFPIFLLVFEYCAADARNETFDYVDWTLANFMSSRCIENGSSRAKLSSF